MDFTPPLQCQSRHITFAKRIVDLAGATLGLIFLVPLFLLVAVAIELDDGGPVFFRQERIGQYGVPFRIWKFRSMVVDAEKRGRAITAAGDPRVTRVGTLLRRGKLDEFPQLINVLWGEMTLVGPRPEVRAYVECYTPHQREVLNLRPGITDPASIAYFDEEQLLASSPDPEATYNKQIIARKIRINIAYANRASIFSDAAIIISTFTSIVRRFKNT